MTTYEEFKKNVLLNDKFLDEGDTVSAINLQLEYFFKLSPKTYKEYMKHYVSELAKPNYYCLYTFTMKPQADPEKARQYVYSIQNRIESLQLVNVMVCEEHADTNRHWHVAVQAKKSLRSDVFKHYALNYGFVHASMRKKTNFIQMSDYITKEGDYKYLVKDSKVFSD